MRVGLSYDLLRFLPRCPICYLRGMVYCGYLPRLISRPLGNRWTPWVRRGWNAVYLVCICACQFRPGVQGPGQEKNSWSWLRQVVSSTSVYIMFRVGCFVYCSYTEWQIYLNITHRRSWQQGGLIWGEAYWSTKNISRMVKFRPRFKAVGQRLRPIPMDRYTYIDTSSLCGQCFLRRWIPS